ncbi:3-oxoadipate enol-lactonase [Fulvimarina sp. MAC3]|uniref:bifunctional 3-oxoadipate enol-lactonase/4-carboxymuconolactone decarboxylase PcaDC n=1 Tax=Fulvimarina sp. MAC3 TaxID=3148887 RepID=UPI0031FD7B38
MAFAVANAVTMHYCRTGRAGAPRLVFLNSLGSDLRIWEEVVVLLEDRFDILLMDMRGHGLTEPGSRPVSIALLADDVTALLDHIGWQTTSIVGLSIGGLIAQHLAVHTPARLEGLILMDTAAKIGEADAWNDRIAAIEKGGVAAIADQVAVRWFSEGYSDREPQRFTAWRRMLTSTTSEGYRAACEALRDADYTNVISQISAPTLAIVGDGDAPTPLALVKTTAERIPGATFRTIEGTGHLPCLERPVEVASAIAGHINGAVARSGETSDRYELGMATRSAVLGPAHVERASAAITPFDAPFQRFITEGAWGSVWSSPNLTHRERSMLTIALLAALGQDDEVAMHVRASANTGANATDIAEVLMHVAVYAGVPAANHAIKIAKTALSEMEAASR